MQVKVLFSLMDAGKIFILRQLTESIKSVFFLNEFNHLVTQIQSYSHFSFSTLKSPLIIVFLSQE
jgi:hypothetical protein